MNPIKRITNAIVFVALSCSLIAAKSGGTSMQLGKIREDNIPGVWLLQTYDEPVYQAGYLTMEENSEIKKAAANKWWYKVMEDRRPSFYQFVLAVVDENSKIKKTFKMRGKVGLDTTHHSDEDDEGFVRKGKFKTLAGKLGAGHTSWSPYQIKQAEFVGDEKSQKLSIKFAQNIGTKKEPKTQETWLIFDVSPVNTKEFNEMEKMVKELSE